MLGNNKNNIGFDSNFFSSSGGNIIDPQALLFYDRVIADGGVVPTGLIGVSATFKAVKAIYGVSDITQALSVFYDAHYLAYKKGTGTGATSGRAIEKLYSACGASGDCVQTTLASQPLLLEHSGTNYVYLSGVSSNYFSTPNAAGNQITSDIEIIAKINVTDITTTQHIVAKRNLVTNIGYAFVIGSSRLNFQFSINGTTNILAQSTVNVPFSANQDYWVKVTRNSSNGNVQFFTSADGVTYTQLGTTVSSTSGSMFNSTQVLEIGSRGSGSSQLLQGVVYYASISNVIGGSPTQIFNPQNYNASISQSTWTSSTGEVWTRNRDVLTTGLKAAIVDYTMLMSNGTSHAMQAASFNFDTAAYTNYTTFAKFNNSVLSIMSELGVDADSSSGYYHGINGSASTETSSINGNVGNNSSVWTQNSLLLKQAIETGDTTLSNPETKYYINNVLATLSAAGGTSNNTANMNGTALNIFARNNGASLFFNGSFRNLLLSKQSDDTTIRTNVYNFIRTNYNNAF
jgi:hypothetical protein